MKRVIVVALLSLVACGNPSTPTDVTVTDVPDLDHGSGFDTVSGDVTDTDRIVLDTAIDAPGDVSPVDVVQDDVAGDVPFDAGQDGHSYDSVTTDEVAVEDDVGIPTDVKTDITQDVCIPTTEECDGEDNDCDGLMDEAGSLNCIVYYEDRDKDGFGVGSGKCLCSPTGYYLALVDGDCDDADSTCNPGLYEKCDNKDNDCDGETDETFMPPGQPCDSNDSDLCWYGVWTCTNEGNWVECIETSLNNIEICDYGFDNDCDGETDEGFHPGEPCTNGFGPCTRYGAWECAEDGSEFCNAEVVMPENENESCDIADGFDDIDNDCDGFTDDNSLFSTTTYEGTRCSEPVFKLPIPDPYTGQKYQIRLTGLASEALGLHSIMTGMWPRAYFDPSDGYSDGGGCDSSWGCLDNYYYTTWSPSTPMYIVTTNTWGSTQPLASDQLTVAVSVLHDGSFEGVLEVLERGTDDKWHLVYQRLITDLSTIECTDGAIPVVEMLGTSPTAEFRDVQDCSCWTSRCAW